MFSFKKLILLMFIMLLLGAGFGTIMSIAINVALPSKIEEKQLILTPSVIPTSTPIPATLSAEELTALVNEWRVSQGFQSYIEHEALCKIARDRADEGPDNHAGALRKYSSFPSILQENLVIADTAVIALNGWLNSSGHRAALEKPYKYSCIACYSDQCNQIFSNLENGTR